MSDTEQTQEYGKPMFQYSEPKSKWYERITKEQIMKYAITAIAGLSIFEMGIIIGQNYPTLKGIRIQENPYYQGGIL